MKYTTFLPFAGLAAAIVIPDAQVMQELTVQAKLDRHQDDSVFGHFPDPDKLVQDFEKGVHKAIDTTKNAFDSAVDFASKTGDEVTSNCHGAASNAKAWIESAGQTVDNYGKHHGHHGGHHHKPNMTVYELIAKSKYTTKLAALINEYDDLVDLLNSTKANFTVFAPIDKAFEKIPEDAPKPSKEELKQVLLYHVSADFYPAGRVLVTHTIPTLHAGEGIGGKKQRASINISLKGLTLNFYSRVIAIDVFGTNGVIHGLDNLLIPPPKAADVISLLPGEFSTLELGLEKTGLYKVINDTSNHVGGTLFAPSNFAFQKLGGKVNAFLFSKYGLKYLAALLKYHVVANKTLYSDAFYEADKNDDESAQGIPKGYLHVDLPTLLKDRALSIDVARYGRIIIIKINGFTTVTIEDGIVYDGVVHVVSSVLIPPKTVAGELVHHNGGEISVDDLKERLEPFVDDSKYGDDNSIEL